MGNTHAATSSQQRKKRLGRQRRMSEPDDKNMLHPRGVPSSSSFSPLSLTPRIQINGKDSMEEIKEDQRTRSMDLPPLSPASVPASARRMQFLSSSNSNNVARSLDDSGRSSFDDVPMKPISRAKSHSPLKQMRTYSYRSLSSEENALDRVSCSLIRSSWLQCTEAAKAAGKDFGFFVFQRVFHKMPEFKLLFNMDASDDLGNLEEDHDARRHTRIFTNVLNLAVKSVEELEAQVAPTIFKYGERHYTTKASDYMTEENVRMVCAQVVCTVCDLLGESAQTDTVESWIEMMRYLGKKLLDGHEYAKLTAKHRISINRNDHHLFLML